MIRIANTQLWVNDQEEALAFYTDKVGMAVRMDVTLPEMGNFRWLTVGPASQPDVAIVLMPVPGPPMMDTETAGQVRDLMARAMPARSFPRPTTAGPPSPSLAGAVSSSSISPRSGHTASTPPSATLRATTCGWSRSLRRSRDQLGRGVSTTTGI